MRSFRATWILVAVIAAMTCLQTGCGFSRMGQNVGNMSLSRPRLLSWRKDKPDRELASSSSRPPRSSIPPAGSGASGSSSRTLPSEPAPNSRFDYASTSNRGGEYSRESAGGGYSSTDKSDGYGDNYVARDSSAASQRGFYNPEYQGESGGSNRFAGSDTRGGYDDYRDTGAASGGYSSRSGSPSSYGPSYGGSGTRDPNYQQVADRRGAGYDDTYGASGSDYGAGDYQGRSQYESGGQSGGGSTYSGADYGAPQNGGGSAYSDTRQVSPRGGGANYDDYRSPAGGNYDATYGVGGNYDATYGTSSTYGGNSGGGASATGGTSGGWLPGSTGRTTPYGQKQLSPPTNSNWGN